VTDWLAGIVHSMGYLGIFLLLILARSVPAVPVESVIPLAGVAAAQGQLSLPLIAVAGGLGSAIGELAWYLPSRLLGRERLLRFLREHGRWLTLEPHHVDRASKWFERYGGPAVALSQPVPILRTVIAIPAGAFQLPIPLFLLYAAIGSGCVTFGAALLGYTLESGAPRVADYLGYLSLGLFGVVMAVYVVRLVRQRSQGPT
jgi:membrane protein DedA with SNARE-associated domain